MQPPHKPAKYPLPPGQLSIRIDDHTRELFPLIWQLTGKLNISSTVIYAITQAAALAEEELKKRGKNEPF